jgi:hypothetical protein
MAEYVDLNEYFADILGSTDTNQSFDFDYDSSDYDSSYVGYDEFGNPISTTEPTQTYFSDDSFLWNSDGFGYEDYDNMQSVWYDTDYSFLNTQNTENLDYFNSYQEPTQTQQVPTFNYSSFTPTQTISQPTLPKIDYSSILAEQKSMLNQQLAYMKQKDSLTYQLQQQALSKQYDMFLKNLDFQTYALNVQTDLLQKQLAEKQAEFEKMYALQFDQYNFQKDLALKEWTIKENEYNHAVAVRNAITNKFRS